MDEQREVNECIDGIVDGWMVDGKWMVSGGIDWCVDECFNVNLMSFH